MAINPPPLRPLLAVWLLAALLAVPAPARAAPLDRYAVTAQLDLASGTLDVQ